MPCLAAGSSESQEISGQSASVHNASASNAEGGEGAADNANFCADAAKPLDFRILTEPVAMRPNKGAYGVPYDLVDASQGSAISEMLQQIQEADSALSAIKLVNESVRSEE